MPDTNKTLETAINLIKESNFNEAKELLNQVIEIEPDNIEAIKSLGLCNVNLNLFDEALINFQKSLNGNPEDALSWYYLGTILESKNDLNAAKNAFRKVIEYREDYVDAYKNLAIVYLKTQEHFKIIDFSQKLIELAPEDHQVYYITALANMGLKNYTEAINLFEKAIELNSKNAVLYNNLGTALMSIQKIDEAIKEFKKAIEVDPDNAISYYNVGIALQSGLKHEEAYAYLKKSYELEPNNFHLNAVALGAFNAEQWEDAIRYYNSLIYANPEKQTYQYNLACAFHAIKDYQKAISLLENLSLVNTKTTQIAEKLADIYIEIGNFDSAKNVYATLMHKGKVSPNIYYQYAMLCAKTNEMDKAESILKKVIILEPNNAIAHKDLAIIYLTNRLFDYAKEEFEAAYKLEPKNPYIIFEFGNYWHLMSNYKEAKKYYDKLSKVENLTTNMLLGIGLNYIALKKTDKAIEILSNALKLNPQSTDIIQNLAKVYFMKKQYEVAKELLEDAYFLEQNAETANSLALVYFELKEYEEANKLFYVINQTYPNNPNNLLNMAKCQLALNNKEKSEELLNKILEIFPEHEEASKLLNSINK